MSFKKYFKCKSIESLVDESKKSQGLERTFGAFQLIMLGIGAIIGAGIFVFVGPAAGQHAGPAVTLSIALAGLACACAALCYAEMASAIPISGGAYTYAYAALGELPAWIIVGMITLTYCFGAAAIAAGWSGYAQSFLADYGYHVPKIFSASFGTMVSDHHGHEIMALGNLPALLVVLFITSILYRGSESSATFNTVIVFIKMSVLTALIVIGGTKVDPSNWVPFIPENTGTFGEFGISGVITGAAAVFLAYSGFDAVATAAQETKNPKRNLPIGIVGSLVICALVYVMVALVLTGLAPYQELNVANPMSIAVDKMGMPWFSTAIKIGAVAGLTSVVLVLIFGSVRIFFSICHDGLLPMGLAKVHKKYRTPHILTLIIGVSIAVLSATVDSGSLQMLANFGTLTTFAIVCAGTIYLRYSKPNMKRDFECPLMPFIPLTGIALFIIILASLSAKTFLHAGIWIAFLLIVYFCYGRHNSVLLHPKKKKA